MVMLLAPPAVSREPAPLTVTWALDPALLASRKSWDVASAPSRTLRVPAPLPPTVVPTLTRREDPAPLTFTSPDDPACDAMMVLPLEVTATVAPSEMMRWPLPRLPTVGPAVIDQTELRPATLTVATDDEPSASTAEAVLA